MQTKRNTKESGNVLICVLGAILILSLIGANVLQSSATRLNASTNHVRAWKEALSAAETGGDIAFAQLRNHVPADPSTWGWTPSLTETGTPRYISPLSTFGSSYLQARTVVDPCYFDHFSSKLILGVLPGENTWYRVRSRGTAPLPGLKRTGMDDALLNDGMKHFAAFGSTEMQDITARGNGDSLLRKIDFNADHFAATYGSDGLAPPPLPSISRRTEQLIAPMTPFFDAAIKSAGSFYGLGSASYIDSYNSKNNVPYDPTVRNNSSSPYYSDSRHGNVEINSATATVKGDIYGDVGTNGGNITSGNPGIIYGTIDNNVPFTLVPYAMPSISGWDYQSILTVAGNQNLTPTATANKPAGGSSDAPIYYRVTSPWSGALTVLPAVDNLGNTVETYVAIHVENDISGGNAGITINPKVHAKIYFDGNLNTKTQNIVNTSPNTPRYPNSGPYAGNLQFYGISPTTPGQTQSITLGSGGGQVTLAATFYAPSADFVFNGAPDFFGTAICKTFYANGNITWHYDRALNDDGTIQDYRIASYIEDTR
jgi:hypothetical protein